MKVCPTCKKEYSDGEMNYCLADGSTLVKKRGAKPQERSRLNEVVAVGLVALAVLVFLSLVTGSPDDRSIISTGHGQGRPTQNWIGVVGANLSALLISAVGLTAYFLPPLLVFIAWRLFRSVGLRPTVARGIGYAMIVLAVSGLGYMIEPSYGGVLGGAFPFLAAKLIGTTGTLIVLVAMLVASFLLISNFSIEWLLATFDLPIQNLKTRIREWFERRRLRRVQRHDAALERAQRRRELREHPITAEPPTVPIPDTLIADPVPATILEKSAKQTRAMKTDERIEAADVVSAAGEAEVKPADEAEATPPEEKKVVGKEKYTLPSSELLNPAPPRIAQNDARLRDLAVMIGEKSREFNVAGTVSRYSPGPVVTTFQFKPDAGVKYARVTNLADDLCLALEAESIRIDRIPGTAHVGIEVPNQDRETIFLREVIESPQFKRSASPLTIALGKTISGENYVTDLAKMPHLLIAGATGAGKSVGVNSLVVSMLYKATPDDVLFIMVDPKRLELGLYADIPHLRNPIITEPKEAANALQWAVREMENRYKRLAGYAVRNIEGYNAEAKRRNAAKLFDEDGNPHEKLPYIVIIIDELADLMMVAGKQVETYITRLAQMARAVGIHLVLATQRPSVDVITGLIKANFPARISFRVSSKVDSRTIIDANGAESLLGRGDMLFLPPATSQVIRVHGAYVDEKEIARIVEHVKTYGPPVYDPTVTKSEEEMAAEAGEHPSVNDPLFWDALKIVVNAKRGSTSLLQRHLKIGYGRAAGILDAMVARGYVGEMDGAARARPVLPKAFEELAEMMEMKMPE